MGNNLNHTKNTGFTIVELLIVIAVIGILAAITIIGFNGIQQRAVTASMQTELENAAKQLHLYEVNTGTFPATKADVTTNLNGGQGLKLAAGSSYQYTYNSSTKSYCITLTSTQSPTTAYRYDSSVGRVEAGLCTGDSLPSTGPVFIANAAVVSIFAGTTSGYLDGTGATARFTSPTGLTIDNSGNLYVTDVSDHRIRKITPAGLVSTIGGMGTSGFVDGAASTSRFASPAGVAVDSAGNVYVGDQSNHRIRKITPGGVVSTFAGSGVGGWADGLGTAAQFNYPCGLAVDSADNIYVADSGNNRIRKITPAGMVSTFAGGSSAGTQDGAATIARFSSPMALTVATDGTVYIADTYNHRVRVATSAGVVSTLAGSTSGNAEGTGSAAKFYYVQGIAVDPNGLVYVTDGNNNLIRKITPAGVMTTFAGSGSSAPTDATGVAAGFGALRQIVIDPSGALYVADQGNNRIRKIR